MTKSGDTASRVLIVGAGAVGQVFAHHLRKGGADVCFRVKPRHADAARKGFMLYGYGGREGQLPSMLADCGVVIEGEPGVDRRFDQVWLCTSSQDLREPWLETLAAHSSDATIVAFQPDLDDRRRLIQCFGEERLVQGLIGFLSYQTPLPGETWPQPGVAYWLPPGLATEFDAGAEGVQPVVDALRAGGLPARARAGIPSTSALRSATTMPIVAGLEASGWGLAEFIRGAGLAQAVAASREALQVVDAILGTRSASRRFILRSAPARLALSLAPAFAPFDLEAYLKFHFQKTAVQTRLLIETWIAHGEALGVPTPQLCALRLRLTD